MLSSHLQADACCERAATAAGAHTVPPRAAVTDDMVRDYERDGVVVLRDVMPLDWVESMRTAVTAAVAAPGPYHTDYVPPGGKGRFFGDHFMYRRFDAFREFTFGSPAAEIAARIMRSSQVNFFYDQMFVKEGGTTAPTPWHQDQGYWGVLGKQVCTVWVPFDPIDEAASVEFIRGSHKWGARRYAPKRFTDGSKFPRGLSEDMVDLPDIGALRSADGGRVTVDGKQHDILRFAVRPGDVLVFQAGVVHGSPGMPNGGQGRRLALRWAGDDATFLRKSNPDDPIEVPLSPPPHEMPATLRTGDPIRDDPRAFPHGWGAHKEYVRSHPPGGLPRMTIYPEHSAAAQK